MSNSRVFSGHPESGTCTISSGQLKDKDIASFQNDSVTKSEKPLFYGWFSFTPKWLQPLNNVTSFMIIMTTVNVFLSGTINGVVGSVQSSIETRFSLNSTQSSMIVWMYEISTIPISIFVAYKGTIGCHRPKWTSAFLFVAGFGCILNAIPHFTTPLYLPTKVSGSTENVSDIRNLCVKHSSKYCTKDFDNMDIENDDGSLSIQLYLVMFIFGRVSLGFGTAGLYNFAMVYMDDALMREKFSLYSAIVALAGIIGPALGYIGGGLLLDIYTDFYGIQDNIGFDQNDPRWVGAWWLAYIIGGSGCILSTIPMTGYPPDLPGAWHIRTKKTNEASGTKYDPSIVNLKFDFKPKDILQFTKDVFTNWSWLFLTLFVCCDGLLIGGLGTFGPKYLEVQFSLTSSFAAIFFGVVVVPAGCIGAITGGILVDRFKMSYQSIIKMEFFTTIAISLTGFMFLITCSETDFAGVNMAYYINNSTDISLVDSCNIDCLCENQFDPICTRDNVQYLSPCYAGCLVAIEESDFVVYNNCTCILNTFNVETHNDNGNFYKYQANGGVCNNVGCTKQFAVFSILLFIGMMGIFLCEALNLSTVLRVVPNSHRLFGMMASSILLRLLGTIPGPVLYGYVFDEACSLWQEDCDGKRGSCFHYNNKKLAMYLFIINTSIKVLSGLFIFLSWKLYKPPKRPDVVINEVFSTKL